MISLFLPEIVLCAGILVFLCLCVFQKSPNAPRAHSIGLVAALAFIGASVYTLPQGGSLFAGVYRIDALSQIFKIIIGISLALTLLFSRQWNPIREVRSAEYLLFTLTAALGMAMIPSSVDLLTLFVSLELSAYSLYLLAALRESARTPESAVKYLVFGAAASGISLWGLSLVVGLSGTTSMAVIGQNFQPLSTQPAFLAGMTLFSLSLLFKLSNFPMHFWAPDVYENSATAVTTFIATASKASAVAVLIRVFSCIGVASAFASILGVLAFLSMTLGNTVALVQKDVKRLLAYSSIAQAGYLILGLMAGTPEAFSAAIFYAFAYVVMNSGAFLVAVLVAKHTQNDNPQISDFDGLAEKSPMLSLILLLSLLSLAGIPPLVGFTGKWILFAAAMQKGHGFLVLWAVLNSVVSLFYYLTLVKHAYLNKPKDSKPFLVPTPLQVLCLVFFVLLVAAGFFPQPLVEMAEKAVQVSRLL